ncbi:MAG: cyclodeaminase/cyclohydrolase family protein [Deltaproteobacteria bacterium]|nr:cyclodeaminase/cyclohydrolase family protein [Deltaproteobacteria bacterium]
MDIKRFLEKLSSDDPTPGGGSASALAGAMSAALIGMVAGLTMRKETSKHKEMMLIKERNRRAQKRLLCAVDEDARSYQEVLKAFRFPKHTEKEKNARRRRIEKAFKNATVTPELVSRFAVILLQDSYTVITKGTPNALSDAGVGAFLADTALKGGLMNIEINLGSIKDKAFVKEKKSLIKNLEKRRQHLIAKISKSLTKIG